MHKLGMPGIQNTYGLGDGLGPSLVVPWPSTRKSSWATVIWLITCATRWAIGWLEPTHGHEGLVVCACATPGRAVDIAAAPPTATATTANRERDEAPHHLDRETDRRSRARCIMRLPQR